MLERPARDQADGDDAVHEHRVGGDAGGGPGGDEGDVEPGPIQRRAALDPGRDPRHAVDDHLDHQRRQGRDEGADEEAHPLAAGAAHRAGLDDQRRQGERHGEDQQRVIDVERIERGDPGGRLVPGAGEEGEGGEEDDSHPARGAGAESEQPAQPRSGRRLREVAGEAPQEVGDEGVERDRLEHQERVGPGDAEGRREMAERLGEGGRGGQVEAGERARPRVAAAAGEEEGAPAAEDDEESQVELNGEPGAGPAERRGMGQPPEDRDRRHGDLDARERHAEPHPGKGRLGRRQDVVGSRRPQRSWAARRRADRSAGIRRRRAVPGGRRASTRPPAPPSPKSARRRR